MKNANLNWGLLFLFGTVVLTGLIVFSLSENAFEDEVGTEDAPIEVVEAISDNALEAEYTNALRQDSESSSSITASEKGEEFSDLLPQSFEIEKEYSEGTDFSFNADRVTCSGSTNCLIDAVQKGQEAYYWTEVSHPARGREYIRLQGGQTMRFIPLNGSGEYRLDATIKTNDIIFAENWLELAMAEDPALRADVEAVVSNAEFPAEEELAELYPEERQAFEEYISRFSSAEEYAMDMIRDMYERREGAVIMDSYANYEVTCTSSDVASFVADISEIEGNMDIFFPNLQPYLNCRSVSGPPVGLEL